MYFKIDLQHDNDAVIGNILKGIGEVLMQNGLPVSVTPQKEAPVKPLNTAPPVQTTPPAAAAPAATTAAPPVQTAPPVAAAPVSDVTLETVRKAVKDKCMDPAIKPKVGELLKSFEVASAPALKPADLLPFYTALMAL